MFSHRFNCQLKLVFRSVGFHAIDVLSVTFVGKVEVGHAYKHRRVKFASRNIEGTRGLTVSGCTITFPPRILGAVIQRFIICNVLVTSQT